MSRTLPLAALLLLGAGTQDSDEPKTHVVKRGTLTPVLELEVTFEPARSREIKIDMKAFKGTVRLAMAAPAGSAVKKGDPVLELDAAPVKRAAEAASRAVVVAMAELEKTRADSDLGVRADALALDRARTARKDAEVNLKSFDEVEGKQMLLRADLNLKYSQDSVNDQKEELDQLLKMYKSEELTNATSEIVVRRARRALDRAKTYLEMSKEDTAVIKKIRHPQRRRTYHYAVESARQDLEKLEAAQALAKVERSASLTSKEAELQEKARTLKKLERDLAACTVRAPFDGLVFYGAYRDGAWPDAERTARALKPGASVSTGTVLVTVASRETAARAALLESGYFQVARGQAARVVPVARPGRTLTGTVRGKSMVIRSSGRPYAVRIELAEPPTDLLPGMKGKATLRGDERRDVVLVPCKALDGEGFKRTLKVLDGDRESERPVVAGASDGKMTEILSGLKDGDRVVVPE